MKNYIQKGAVMSYTNASGSDIASGKAVVIGELVGVATGDIADTESGEVAFEGVFSLPKEAPLVISQGDKVYYDAAANEVDKTNTNAFIGYAFVDAASADTTVQVLLARQGA